MIITKNMDQISKEVLIRELSDIAKKGKKRLKRKGLKESDIPELVKKARKK